MEEDESNERKRLSVDISRCLICQTNDPKKKVGTVFYFVKWSQWHINPRGGTGMFLESV